MNCKLYIVRCNDFFVYDAFCSAFTLYGYKHVLFRSVRFLLNCMLSRILFPFLDWFYISHACGSFIDISTKISKRISDEFLITNWFHRLFTIFYRFSTLEFVFFWFCRLSFVVLISHCEWKIRWKLQQFDAMGNLKRFRCRANDIYINFPWS